MVLVQTFLPYPDFQKTAKVLDYKRLGKQRSEALTIIRALTDGNGWENHPAVKMWKGYTQSLKKYHNTIIKEWTNRGYKNNMKLLKTKTPITHPPWLGDKKLHNSHKSNLLRKNPKHYKQYGWKVPKNLDYYWPTKEEYDEGEE